MGPQCSSKLVPQSRTDGPPLPPIACRGCRDRRRCAPLCSAEGDEHEACHAPAEVSHRRARQRAERLRAFEYLFARDSEDQLRPAIEHHASLVEQLGPVVRAFDRRDLPIGRLQRVTERPVDNLARRRHRLIHHRRE